MGLGMTELLILAMLVVVIVLGPSAAKKMLKLYTWYKGYKKVADAKVRQIVKELEEGRNSPEEAEKRLEEVTSDKE